jgi:hypothetical protein
MVRQFCCAELSGFPRPVVAQNSAGQQREAVDFHEPTIASRVMVTILLAIVSIITFRVRSRAALELKLIALQHQLAVLHRQRPGRAQLSPLIGFDDCCFAGSGPRSLTRWYRSSPQP